MASRSNNGIHVHAKAGHTKCIYATLALERKRSDTEKVHVPSITWSNLPKAMCNMSERYKSPTAVEGKWLVLVDGTHPV